MGVIDELERAREAFDRRDWLEAYRSFNDAEPDSMEPADLVSLATIAYLVGNENDCIQALQRAFQAHLDAGDELGAARCGYHLARTLILAGEMAVASGWVARSQRLVDDHGADVVEGGYLRVPRFFECLGQGDLDGAIAIADEIEEYGRRFDDPDLVATALTFRGRAMLYTGSIADGLRHLDEAMTSLSTGEVSVVVAGLVYCAIIEACQEISDLGRAAEWTAALVRWCDTQPGLVAYTGQCALHRGQIMRLNGRFTDALAELDRARERYARAGTEVAAGLTFYEQGQILRLQGDDEGAEAAYDRAIEFGLEAQPGLAQLWMQQGRIADAVDTMARLLAEREGAVERIQLLPAAVDIFLAADDVDRARSASEELSAKAQDYGYSTIQARAAAAAGAVALAEERHGDAASLLRQAVTRWSQVGDHYERSRCRALLSRALSALGDERSASTEREAAERDLRDLGAQPALAELGVADRVPAPGGLSPREIEVLRLVARGDSNSRIAETLVISEKTVARHLSNIFTKLDVSSRTAAAAFAYENGIR